MKLPRVSGVECVKAFVKIGYVLWSRKGSHATLKNESTGQHITIPLHSELDPGTLRSIIREAGITVDDFLSMIGKK